MPFKDKEQNRTYQRDWQRKHRIQHATYQREYVRRIRQKVLDLLGGKCVYCGCDVFEALEINHINGGGRKSRKLGNRYFSKSWHLAILKGTLKRDDLELTCRVCNARHYLTDIKKVEGSWRITWIPQSE